MAARWFALALFVLFGAICAQVAAIHLLGVHAVPQFTAADINITYWAREMVALFCALFGAYAILGLPWREIGLKAPRWRDAMLGVGFGVPSLLAIYALLYFARLPASALDRFYTYLMMHASGVTAVSLFIIVGIVSPVVQEIVFRGIVLEALLRYMNAILAIGLASLVFGALHVLGGPSQMVFALLTGIVQGYLYWKTRSIVGPSIVHILANGYAMVALWMSPRF